MKYLYRYLYYLARLVWFMTRPHTYGAGVIIVKDGMLLMVRHTYGDRNLWHFPGGGRKSGETPKENAIREIKEELGIVVSPSKLADIYGIEHYRHIHSVCFITNDFKGKIVADDKEIEEWRWWRLDSLPAMSPITKLSAEKYIDSNLNLGRS